MTVSVLYVSVNRSFEPEMSLAQLEPWVERAWALTVAKASACDRVVAVLDGHPLAVWRVRGAYPTDETYQLSDHSTRPRAGLSLGDPLPVLPIYREQVPALRRGVAVAELDLPELPPERR